jgi:hypothetical protein
MVKQTKKYVHLKPNIEYIAVFQHKHKKIDAKLFKSFIMETFMLPLSFDELNTKFKKM